MTNLVDISDGVRRLRRETWVALGLSAALLVYNNSISVLPHDLRDRILLPLNLGALVLVLLVVLLLARLSLAELGLDRSMATRSAVYGIALSAIATIPAVAFILVVGALDAELIEVERLSERSGAGMAYFLLVRQPVGTALFEELVFRGALFGVWRRAGGDKAALLGTAMTFCLWHVVIVSRTMVDGDVGGLWAVIGGTIATLIGLLFVGLFFALLRWRTQSIVAGVLTHWLIVAGILVAVWAAW